MPSKKARRNPSQPQQQPQPQQGQVQGKGKKKKANKGKANTLPPKPPKTMPQNHNQRDSYRPSPPRGPPPDMYQFRGQAPRDGDRRQDNFSFNMPGPRFDPPPRDYNRPVPPRRRSPPRGPQRGGKSGPYGRPQGYQGGFQKRGASERVILRSKRDSTPERLEGMGGGTSFRAIEDLSDSEAEMDVSDDDAAVHSDADRADGEGRPAKRARNHVSTADDVPKWSNPDPYTSLPPPDESQTKKKDMVQLIRKAKVAAEEGEASQDAVAANADFISFDFDAELDADTLPDGGMTVTVQEDRFSHLDNLHPNRRQVPSRPLADRIEGAPTGPAGSSAFTPTNRDAAGNIQAHVASVNGVRIDRWPPQDKHSAVMGSHRRLDLDDGDSSGPPRGPQAGPLAGKKRKRVAPLDGSIVEDWEALPGADRTPWCTADHSTSSSVASWLNKEVQDFYDYVRPYHFEEEVRADLITRVSRALDKVERGGKLFSFGSYAAGIYLPTADLDLVWASTSFLDGGYPKFCKSRKWMYMTLHQLINYGVAKPGGEVIWGAKVPILKITDPVTNLHVDISFENMTGVVANQTFREWKDRYAAMPILVTVIKQFLLMRGLNEVHTGGIGGFTVTCLVTSLLQHLPAVQSGDMRPEEHLGEMLMEFLDLYGNKFNYRTTGIEMSPPGYFRKRENAKMDRLCVMDPNKRDNDISGGSHKVALVFDAFRHAYGTLQQRLAYLAKCHPDQKRDASILGTILGGNYTSFRSQRDHLKKLWDR